MVDLFRERKWDLVSRRWIYYLISLALLSAGLGTLVSTTCSCASPGKTQFVLQVQRTAHFEYLFAREFAKDEADALNIKRTLLDALPATEGGLGEGRAIEVPQLDMVTISTRASTQRTVDSQDRKIQQVLREEIGTDFEASKQLTRVDEAVLGQVIAITERRLSASGVRDARVAKQLPDKIVVEIPDLRDPKAALALIQKAAVLEFKHIPPDITQTITEEGKPEFYRGDKRISTRRVLDEAELILTGSDLQSKCRVGTGPPGHVHVTFTWKSEASTKFRDFTMEHLDQYVAIVLDGELVSAPIIRAPIGRHGLISGDFTVKEATELANLLNAGALPAPLRLVEEKVQ